MLYYVAYQDLKKDDSSRICSSVYICRRKDHCTCIIIVYIVI